MNPNTTRSTHKPGRPRTQPCRGPRISRRSAPPCEPSAENGFQPIGRDRDHRCRSTSSTQVNQPASSAACDPGHIDGAGARWRRRRRSATGPRSTPFAGTSHSRPSTRRGSRPGTSSSTQPTTQSGPSTPFTNPAAGCTWTSVADVLLRHPPGGRCSGTPARCQSAPTPPPSALPATPTPGALHAYRRHAHRLQHQLLDRRQLTPPRPAVSAETLSARPPAPRRRQPPEPGCHPPPAPTRQAESGPTVGTAAIGSAAI